MALLRVDCCVCNTVVREARQVHINGVDEHELCVSHTYCEKCAATLYSELGIESDLPVKEVSNG